MSVLNKILEPDTWSSAWRPIRFEYEYVNANINFTVASGGKLFVAIPETSFGTLAFTQAVVNDSQRIYINDGNYAGFHDILSYGGGLIETNTDIVDAPTGATTLRVLWKPVVEVLVNANNLGFKSFGKFNTEVSPDITIKFGVEGIVRSNWQFQPPVNGVDYNMFRIFQLRFLFRDETLGNGFTEAKTYRVLNSSIKSAELNQVYANTDEVLQKHPPFVFSCSASILSKISGNVVLNTFIENGNLDPVGDYNGSDYDNDDYFTD